MLAIAAAHLVRVDAQCQAGISVSELAHHVGRIFAVGDEDRRERPPQRVRREALRQPLVPFAIESLIRTRHSPREDASAHVARLLRRSRARPEHRTLNAAATPPASTSSRPGTPLDIPG